MKRKAAFVLAPGAVLPVGQEEQLFDLLHSPEDSTAWRAFVQLIVAEPGKVRALSIERDRGILQQPGEPLPLFVYRFLPPLAELTAYCRARGFDHLGFPRLRRSLDSLRAKLPFSVRHRLENPLISTLTFSDVTAVEYWALLHQPSDRLAFSSGRILDVFYSRYWNQILIHRAHFEFYSKKAALFSQLGINGACNNYLLKFAGAPLVILAQLRQLPPLILQLLERS